MRSKVLDVIVSAWNDVYDIRALFPRILNHRLTHFYRFTCIYVGAAVSLVCAAFLSVSLALCAHRLSIGANRGCRIKGPMCLLPLVALERD
jgi:hypothetical protein